MYMSEWGELQGVARCSIISVVYVCIVYPSDISELCIYKHVNILNKYIKLCHYMVYFVFVALFNSD